MPGPENCGGIDMLFIISFCINYISRNGKEERAEMGEGGTGNLVCAVRQYRVLLDLFCSLSLLIKTRDHKVQLMKVSGAPCWCVCVCFMC